jgi:hypothetical protein
MQCSYDPTTNEITFWYFFTPLPGLVINPDEQSIKSIINLSNDTYSDNGIIRKLTVADNTTFLKISAQLPITDELLTGLMKSRYYTTVFLPYTLLFFDFISLGEIGGEFIPVYYLFSAICVPYTIADYIAFLNPKYKSQITGNTAVSDLIRLLLIVPGLPFSLLFYIFLQFAPNAGA